MGRLEVQRTRGASKNPRDAKASEEIETKTLAWQVFINITKKLGDVRSKIGFNQFTDRLVARARIDRDFQEIFASACQQRVDTLPQPSVTTANRN